MPWEKEHEDGMQQFVDAAAKSNGLAMQLVLARDFEAARRAAEAGDEQAQGFMFVLAQWDQLTAPAIKEGTFPGCFACDAVIKPGENFGGLVACMPIKGETGVLTGFCIDCISLGRRGLLRVLVETVKQQISSEGQTLQ
jgi:hypothetical protein